MSAIAIKQMYQTGQLHIEAAIWMLDASCMNRRQATKFLSEPL